MTKCGKKRRRFKKGLIGILILVFVLTVPWLFLSYIVNPVIRDVTQEEIRALTVDAINIAASEVMTNDVSYADILQISKDNEGNITLIQANTVLINKIARNTTLKSQENISEIGQQGIPIPVGSLSGLSFLAGRGPNISIKVLPVGSVDTKFSSEFISAGINQTKHKIYLTVSAEVCVVIPGMNNSVTTQTQILICENVIVGKIPEFYLQSNHLDELLNLVP